MFFVWKWFFRKYNWKHLLWFKKTQTCQHWQALYAQPWATPKKQSPPIGQSKYITPWYPSQRIILFALKERRNSCYKKEQERAQSFHLNETPSAISGNSFDNTNLLQKDNSVNHNIQEEQSELFYSLYFKWRKGVKGKRS